MTIPPGSPADPGRIAGRIEALARHPSPAKWMAIGAVCEDLRAADALGSADHLSKALSHWPAVLRRIRFSPQRISENSSWQIDRRSSPMPHVGLARTLELSVADAMLLDPDGPALSALSEFVSIAEVHGSIQIDDRDGVRALVRCLNRLSTCRTLDLSGLALYGGQGGGQDAFMPFWKGLLSRLIRDRIIGLRLDGLPVGPACVALLEEVGLARSLRHLGLAGCGVGSRGTRLLAGWKDAPLLFTLDLSANQVETRAARALLRTFAGGRLRALSLARNALVDPLFDPTSTWEGRLELQALDVSATALGTTTLRTLADGSLTPQLSDLRMARSSVTDAAAECLIASAFWQRVVLLDFSETALTDAFVEVLIGAPPPPNLQSLTLRETAVGPAAMSALREWAKSSVNLPRTFDLQVPPLRLFSGN